jgi:hypothetical protein
MYCAQELSQQEPTQDLQLAVGEAHKLVDSCMRMSFVNRSLRSHTDWVSKVPVVFVQRQHLASGLVHTCAQALPKPRAPITAF